ncbi:MAG: hypothetical protein K6B52_00520 [Clostridiales bacterium]|nr:hypothetical protein [Clostridiales bacterium]
MKKIIATILVFAFCVTMIPSMFASAASYKAPETTVSQADGDADPTKTIEIADLLAKLVELFKIGYEAMTKIPWANVLKSLGEVLQKVSGNVSFSDFVESIKLMFGKSGAVVIA